MKSNINSQVACRKSSIVPSCWSNQFNTRWQKVVTLYRFIANSSKSHRRTIWHRPPVERSSFFCGIGSGSVVVCSCGVNFKPWVRTKVNQKLVSTLNLIQLLLFRFFCWMFGNFNSHRWISMNLNTVRFTSFMWVIGFRWVRAGCWIITRIRSWSCFHFSNHLLNTHAAGRSTWGFIITLLFIRRRVRRSSWILLVHRNAFVGWVLMNH